MIDPSLSFRFQIGSVPVGVYKGDPQAPDSRRSRRTYPEVKSIQTAFTGLGMDRKKLPIFRLAICLSTTGHVDELWLVQLHEENRGRRKKANVVDAWKVYDSASALVAPTTHFPAAAANGARVVPLAAPPTKRGRPRLKRKTPVAVPDTKRPAENE